MFSEFAQNQTETEHLITSKLEIEEVLKQKEREVSQQRAKISQEIAEVSQQKKK